ncbi:S8 family serine peptidase [Bdellovibrio sp. HCB337]|uniref:S8 family serine peptidase n=1 Tax=Bdellovibrio sp. HCB337 TaxID=3394358 RepID=UPI0039A587B8
MTKLSKCIFVAASLAMTAQAGTVLRLNAGTIETKRAESLMTAQLGNPAAAQDLIVQFKKPITEADKASLKNIGAEIFGYLPDDALMIRASWSKVQQWRQNGAVEAVLHFRADYKVSTAFAPSSIFNKDEQTAVLVKTFKPTETKDIALAIKNMAQSTVHVAEGKSVVAVVPRGMVRAVAALQGVEHVQPYVEMKPMHMTFDNDYGVITPLGIGDYSDINGTETGTKVMNFDGAWAMGLTGRNQIVAMADTGLDGGETNLSVDFQGAVIKGHIFGLFAKSWEDPMGHGTHVAGSVLGRGTASGARLKGGAYDAMFIPQGMWSPMMKNLTVPSKVQDLFIRAYADGARIHTNSWGSPRNLGAYDAYASSVDEFLFNNPDMLILFAAGNSGVDMNKDGRIDSGSISSPGTSKNALTVGASENQTTTGGIQVPVSKLRTGQESWGAEPIYSSLISDNPNGVAMFSSRGPTLDGRLKPEIVAPGTNILSNRSHVAGASELWGAYNADYAFSGGTSMATPLAAGGAAVVRQVLQEKFQIANPSGALMKATMMHTAVDMFPGQYGEVGAAKGQELLTRRPNADEGYGRVDMTRIAQMTAQTRFVDNKVGLGQNEQEMFTVTLARPGQILVNLVYTDAPASPDAAVAMVNDLDINVSGGGVTSAPRDRVNNNEIVELNNLPAGTYTITVMGTKVPQGKNGKQPYALVYTAREN